MAVLVRLEDLIYNHPEVRAQAPDMATSTLAAAATAQLVDAVLTSSQRPGAAHHLVVLCPASPLAYADESLGGLLLHRLEVPSACVRALPDPRRHAISARQGIAGSREDSGLYS